MASHTTVQSKLFVMLVLLVLLASAGCDLVDGNVLSGVREYFPAAEVLKPRPNVLEIQTHVGHLSEKFILEVFNKMHEDKGRILAIAMAASGYTDLVLGFDEYRLVWTPARNGVVILPVPQSATEMLSAPVQPGG